MSVGIVFSLKLRDIIDDLHGFVLSSFIMWQKLFSRLIESSIYFFEASSSPLPRADYEGFSIYGLGTRSPKFYKASFCVRPPLPEQKNQYGNNFIKH